MCPAPVQTVTQRRFLDVLPTSGQAASKLNDLSRIARGIKDRQRGIQIAFFVPETHLASAIAYLLGSGLASVQFPVEITERLQSLTTPCGWSLCIELLKVRLEMRAQKLRNTRTVDKFYRVLETQAG